MDYPSNLDPINDPEPPQCSECKRTIYHSNESDVSDLCNECYKTQFDDFVEEVFRPIFK